MPVCPICRRESAEELVYPADLVLTAEIRSQNKSWKDSDGICPPCLAEYEKRLAG